MHVPPSSSDDAPATTTCAEHAHLTVRVITSDVIEEIRAIIRNHPNFSKTEHLELFASCVVNHISSSLSKRPSQRRNSRRRSRKLLHLDETILQEQETYQNSTSDLKPAKRRSRRYPPHPENCMDNITLREPVIQNDSANIQSKLSENDFTSTTKTPDHGHMSVRDRRVAPLGENNALHLDGIISQNVSKEMGIYKQKPNPPIRKAASAPHVGRKPTTSTNKSEKHSHVRASGISNDVLHVEEEHHGRIAVTEHSNGSSQPVFGNRSTSSDTSSSHQSTKAALPNENLVDEHTIRNTPIDLGPIAKRRSLRNVAYAAVKDNRIIPNLVALPGDQENSDHTGNTVSTKYGKRVSMRISRRAESPVRSTGTEMNATEEKRYEELRRSRQLLMNKRKGIRSGVPLFPRAGTADNVRGDMAASDASCEGRLNHREGREAESSRWRRPQFKSLRFDKRNRLSRKNRGT